jgi:hypothetical protein
MVLTREVGKSSLESQGAVVVLQTRDDLLYGRWQSSRFDGVLKAARGCIEVSARLTDISILNRNCFHFKLYNSRR